MSDILGEIEAVLARAVALVREESRRLAATVAQIRQDLSSLQSSTADRRFRQLQQDVDELEAVFQRLVDTARGEGLEKALDLRRRLEGALDDAALGAVARRLGGVEPLSMASFCERLLGAVVEVAGAERGLVLLILPDSGEAQVVAPLALAGGQLSRRECAYSRTLVSRAVGAGRPVLVSDATRHPEFMAVRSIQDLRILSVLVVPLHHGGRPVGALYLEDRRLTGTFDERTLRRVEASARFAMAALQRTRLVHALLPHGTSLMIDEARAPRTLLGNDPRIVSLRATIDRVASRGASVLIEGESGTGKELVARALHEHSSRRHRPFVSLNCAAIPSDLFESQLFGHEKHAFTGAGERRPGLVEEAQGGTLFLDEIHELPLPMQPKLLRFLEEREYRPVGGRMMAGVDVQVVAAASRSLGDLVKAGAFLDALYYRLNVVTLTVPPLRERPDDVPLLIDHFLAALGREHGRTLRVEPEVYERLRGYPFPGNVRELRNLLWRLVLLVEGNRIGVEDLPPEVRHAGLAALGPVAAPIASDEGALVTIAGIRRRRSEVQRLLAQEERTLVQRVLRETGNATKAAADLGISRARLYKILGKGAL